jgi:hypothetical protein
MVYEYCVLCSKCYFLCIFKKFRIFLCFLPPICTSKDGSCVTMSLPILGLRIADMVWHTSLGVVHGANNPLQ